MWKTLFLSWLCESCIVVVVILLHSSPSVCGFLCFDFSGRSHTTRSYARKTNWSQRRARSNLRSTIFRWVSEWASRYSGCIVLLYLNACSFFLLRNPRNRHLRRAIVSSCWTALAQPVYAMVYMPRYTVGIFGIVSELTMLVILLFSWAVVSTCWQY